MSYQQQKQYQQREAVKKIKKKNLELKKHVNWIENFMRGVQQYNWTGKNNQQIQRHCLKS